MPAPRPSKMNRRGFLAILGAGVLAAVELRMVREQPVVVETFGTTQAWREDGGYLWPVPVSDKFVLELREVARHNLLRDIRYLAKASRQY